MCRVIKSFEARVKTTRETENRNLIFRTIGEDPEIAFLLKAKFPLCRSESSQDLEKRVFAEIHGEMNAQNETGRRKMNQVGHGLETDPQKFSTKSTRSQRVFLLR